VSTSQEDLPRHERRFKERPHEKVIQEIGLLNGAFQPNEARLLVASTKLNRSLASSSIAPETHMWAGAPAGAGR